MRSRSSRRTLPTKRSAIALARGARTGVLMMRMSVAVKTASNAVLVQPVQPDGVEVEQVAREDRVGLGPQELGP
jgi:hypothetical protein